jgi:hypothetical protein
MYTLFVILTIATIISQTVHSWFVFQSFSRLDGWIKQFQAIMFCSIISVAIFAFVIIGKPNLALLGAIIEIIINIYYYAMTFFEKGIAAGSRSDDKSMRKKSILKFWRMNWIAMFFGFLLPLLIYIFAKQMLEFE